MRSRALLRADLNDAIGSLRRVGHPAPFLDEKRERLLDINILAGLASEHRQQGVPVVGSRDDDGVDIFTIK